VSSSVHPFESVDSAHDYVGLLLQSIQETALEIGQDLHEAHAAGETQRCQAFQLVAYKLERLRVHIAAGRRLLVDLRTLRGIFHRELPTSTSDDQ